MGETRTGIAINYVLGAEDAKNADANPFYYTKGTGKITLEAPTREGYSFDGWTLTENSTDYLTEVSTDTDAITVYAHWTAKTPETKPDDSKKDDSKNTETKTTYYKVTFQSNGGSAVTADKTLTAKWKVIKVSKITITGSSKQIAAGKKIKLKSAKTKVKAGKKVTVKATVTPTKQVNKKLTWKTSNKKYATVNSKGVVTTKKAGKGKTVTITAYATDGSGKKATCKIKITK